MSNSIAATVGSSADEGAPPPLPHRRPRVREVSSRFMSPSSAAGDLHSISIKSPRHAISTPAPDRSSKPSHRRLLLPRQEQEPFAHDNIPDTIRSFDTPSQNTKSTHRKQQRLYKENNVFKSSSRTSKCARPDTPTDRIVPSRFKLPQRQTTSSVTDAAKLLQSFSSKDSSQDSDNTTVSQSNDSGSIQGNSCPNSPLSSQYTKTWHLPDTRSSMPDGDTLSTRLLLPSSSCSSSSNQTSTKSSSTPSLCSRSLTLPISSFKSSDTTLYKPSTTNSLPPQPNRVDSKKGRKLHSSHDQVHSLKLLYNHYLLWRYANAKAQASMDAQRKEIENQFFSLGADISHLRDAVKRKQVELAVLQRVKALSTILDAQMPYLDEWSGLEEDYTYSLSGATNALTNSLLRLPVNGSVEVNIKEAAEALDSAVKTMETIVHHVQRFVPKAEEMDSLMSELATVIDIEKALVEECGNLLAKTHTSQVEDCSLRGHLMQLYSYGFSNISNNEIEKIQVCKENKI